MAMRRLFLLVVPATSLLAIVYVWPMLGLFRTAFKATTSSGAIVEGWSLSTWATILDDEFTLQLTLNSFRLALSSTLLALLLAYPLSLFLYRTQSRFRSLLIMVAIAPILVSSVVRMYGWLSILGDRGLFNSALLWLGVSETPLRIVYDWPGVIIGMAEVVMPYMVLTFLSGFGRLNPAIEEAARSLGATPFRAFWRVTLPLSMPAIVTAAGLGFVICMSAYVTPKLIGGGRVFVLSTEIFEQATTNTNIPAAAVLSLYMLTLLAGLLLIFGQAARRIKK
jgi:putative spermidine/putrescine transport system permease protein